MQNRKRDTDVQNRLLDSVGEVRVGCLERTGSKHLYYQGWNRPPAQVWCMRQVFWAGALGRPRGIGWRGRWEGGSGWGIHLTPWLIHVNVWQNPLQYCKVISLQLIKNKKDTACWWQAVPGTVAREYHNRHEHLQGLSLWGRGPAALDVFWPLWWLVLSRNTGPLGKGQDQA